MKQIAFLTLLLASACKPVDSIADVLLVASVEISPATATLTLLETLQLQAIPRTEGGLELPARNVSWVSSAPSKLFVSDSGEVRALAAGGPFTVTATIEGVQGEAQITVLGTAGQLSITRQPSGNVQSGVPFPTQPAILVKDVRGTPIGGIVVTAELATGGGALGGTLTATSSASGTATFSNLFISGLTGTRKLSFSATGAPSVTSSDISVSAGPASQLIITRQPGSPAVANASFVPQPVIQLRDAWGNPVSQSGVAVSAAIHAAAGDASLGGTTTVNTNGSGTATFSSLKLTEPGSYTLKFTSPGVVQAISNIINVL